VHLFLGVNALPDHGQIANRGPHLRGELKTKIKPFTKIMYGFRSGQNKKTIAFNRKLAEDLKEEACFAFKVCSSS
jgi:hypothetical protein